MRVDPLLLPRSRAKIWWQIALGRLENVERELDAAIYWLRATESKTLAESRSDFARFSARIAKIRAVAKKALTNKHGSRTGNLAATTRQQRKKAHGSSR